MKKFIALLAVVLLLGMTSAACAGLDFDLEFSRDFDAEENSASAELGFSLDLDPFGVSLTYIHDILPDPADALEVGVDLTLGPLTFGYERELTIDDPGVGTVEMDIGPISLEYEYEFDVDTSGTLTATLSKSF